MKKNQKKPWIVLAVCCGLAASSIGISINSSGVFYTPVSESLNMMRGTFAMHMTIFSFVTALSAFVVPVFMRKFSYKLILVVSVAIAVIATAFMGFVDTAFMFNILGGIRGFATGMFSIVPLTMIINEWFHKKHGFATSFVFGFSGLAGSICSPILSQCIEIFGWQMSYIIKALIILVLCLPAILYPFTVHPQDEGILPYGFDEKTLERFQSKVSVFRFLTVGFIGFFILALMNTMITGITQHLPGFAESIGYTSTVGATLLSAGMVGNIISKLLIGIMSDRFGPMKATITMMSMNMLGIISLIFSPHVFGLYIGAFLFGSIYSVGAVGLPLLCKYFFGLENYNKVFPSISFASNLGAAVALSIVGYIYDFMGSYIFAFILGLGINILCFILLMIVMRYQHKEVIAK